MEKIKDTCIIDGNKIRIQTDAGQDSVLFEDIASLGFKRVAIGEYPSTYILGIICLIIGLSGMMFGWIFMNGIASLILGLAVVILGNYLMKQTYFYFDQISVETRGGKIILYGVNDTFGQSEIDRIEEAKRNRNY
jgi:membrane-bound ClpP family serine protease